MRKPQRPNSAKRQVVASPRTIVAPFKGWYTLEGDLQMPQGSAKLLDNFWPEADVVSLRKGSLAHFDNLPGRVETLMAYRTGSTAQLFAAAADGIYDVSSAGSGTAPLVARSVGRCAFTNFTGSGGQFLIVVNGTDAPLKYDGSRWTQIAVADGGPANINDLNAVWSYRSRLYFLAKDSTKFYYLPADSIGGTLNTFDAGGSRVLPLSGCLAPVPACQPRMAARWRSLRRCGQAMRALRRNRSPASSCASRWKRLRRTPITTGPTLSSSASSRSKASS